MRRKPASASVTQTSRSSAMNVSRRTYTSPLAPRWSAASPNGTGGPTSASSSGAARFATSTGMYTSVQRGPWSPWSSVEPTGTMTVLPPPSRYSRTSRFVISGMNIERGMLGESEPAQVLARAAHGVVDVGERRPRLALELELDGEGTGVAGLLEDLEYARE